MNEINRPIFVPPTRRIGDPRLRYQTDPIFHALVHGLASLSQDHGLTKQDIVEAADLAMEVKEARASRRDR